MKPLISDVLAGDAVALFDLDGVLLDTEGLYTQATQAVVGRFGKAYDFSIKRHTMGRDARVGARYMLERLQIPLGADEFLREREPILDELLRESPVMPGAREFVDFVASRGVRMAVATSSSRRLYELKVARHDFFGRFDAVVCGDDPRVGAKKPAPDIFLVAARELDAEPGRCVVFEDSPAGVEAAIAAGMRVMVLPDPALDSAEFPGAHDIAPGHWREILASVDSALAVRAAIHGGSG